MKKPLPGVIPPALPPLKTSPPAAPATAPPAPASPELAPPSATPHSASRALLLQTAEIPAETARLVRCHNPWPTEDVHFCSEDTLPAFVTGIPALSSGPELWIAIHNHRPEPLCLHSGQNIGVLEIVTLADTPPATSQPGPAHQTPGDRASLTAPAATIERLVQRVQRCLQSGRRRSRLYSAAGAHHRDARTSASPTLPTTEPGCSTGGDGAGPANAGQRRHPPLQQSVGFAGSDGQKKGR